MIITHIQHPMEHAELEKYLKHFGNILPAHDGMEINF